MSVSGGNPFKGRQYSGEVILMAVRWYLRYPLAYQHVSDLLAERGLAVDSQLHLPLGTSLCCRVEQAVPPASEACQEELPRGRDLH